MQGEMSRFEKQSREELLQLNGTLESCHKNITQKDAIIDKLRADIDNTRKSNYQLNFRLQTNEKKVAQLQMEWTSMNEDAMREKEKASELQRTLAAEARAMRQKYDAIKNAVTIALKDVRSLKSELQEEKDSMGVALSLIQQQVAADMSTVNLALKVHTQLKEDFEQKSIEAEAAAHRVGELERALDELQEQSQLQLRKQSSLNASLHSERALLLAQIEELSGSNQNDALLVENLTYELEFKNESLNEAEAKIEEQGRMMARNQKLFEKTKEKLQQEAAALRSQVVDLKATCSAHNNSNNSRIVELEDSHQQQLQQQAVLERTLTERQAELSSWKEKAAALTTQLQQMEQALRKQEDLVNSARSDSAQRQQEMNDVLAEMETYQLKDRELQQSLKCTTEAWEDTKNQRLADQEEKTLLEKLLEDSNDRLDAKTAALHVLNQKYISLELEVAAQAAEIDSLKSKIDTAHILTPPAAPVAVEETSVGNHHHRGDDDNGASMAENRTDGSHLAATMSEEATDTAPIAPPSIDVDDLECKLLDVAMQMDFLHQEDEDLMLHINQSKLALGRSLYKLNMQFKKKKKLLDSKLSNGRSSLRNDSIPARDSIILATPQRSKEPVQISSKENIPSRLGFELVSRYEDPVDAANRSMNSLDLTISPLQASAGKRDTNTNTKRPDVLGIGALSEKELSPVRRKLNNLPVPKKAAADTASSSAMKVEEGGDSSLNSLLAFSALDDDSPSEGSSTPIPVHSPPLSHAHSNRRPLRSLSPAVTSQISSRAAHASRSPSPSPSSSSRRSPLNGQGSNSFPVRSPQDTQKDALKEELRLSKVRENDLMKLLEVRMLTLTVYSCMRVGSNSY